MHTLFKNDARYSDHQEKYWREIRIAICLLIHLFFTVSLPIWTETELPSYQIYLLIVFFDSDLILLQYLISKFFIFLFSI